MIQERMRAQHSKWQGIDRKEDRERGREEEARQTRRFI